MAGSNRPIALRSQRIPNLALRVLTACVGIPLVLVITWLGDWPFALALALTAGIGAHEIYAMLRHKGYRPLRSAGIAASMALPVLPMLSTRPERLILAALTALTAVSFAYFLLPSIYAGGFLNAALTIVPVILVGVFLSNLTLLRLAHGGMAWVLITLLVTWAYDTGAYFAGSLFGRHPFMQHVSPKKTREGVLGGLLLAALVSLVAVPAVGLAPWQAPILGLLLGVVAQIGDLAESMIKRQTGVKDSGGIIPGHGGLLDRIDSLLFTGTLAWYAALVLGYAS